jgi:sugar phosphate isomerase/epimerase
LPEGGLPFSIVEFSTLNASFEEDLAAYSAAGIDGIGICELKLVQGRESEQLTAFRESGLKASACIPAVPSFLSLPELPGPESPEERLEAILAGMRRLAPFEPEAFVCLTGPAGRLSNQEAHALVVDGLRTLAAEGARLGVPVGLEPMSSHYRDDWTIPTTLGEAAALADEADVAGLGLVFDTWQLWDSPQLFQEIQLYAGRIVAVHVADWREPTRSWCDRVLPGDGVIDLAGMLDALEASGWTGFYELEMFSDDGAFGSAYEDSLWQLPAPELASKGRDAFVSLTSTVF